MKNQKFDIRLLLYQSILELPVQVVMLDIYNRLPPKEAQTYLAMAALNIGSYFGCLRLAQTIYEGIHKNQASKDSTTYYVSPLAEHRYNVAYENYTHNVQAGTDPSRTPLDDILENNPAYSKAYMDSSVLAYSAKSTYGALNSPYQSYIGSILYGLSQPLCVLLEDSKNIK